MPPQPVAPPRVEHATTVRNDVNLKKGSLKFLRDRRCPERLYLEFSFDAGQPCAITVYYAHRSDEGVPPGTSLVQRLVPYRAPHCGRRTLFRKGLGQTYSQALLEGGCEWLDLRAFNEEELTNAPGTGDGAPQSSAVALGGSAAAASPAGVPAERYAALPPNLFPVVITIETVPEGDPAHAAACAAGPTGTSVPVAGPAAAAAAPGSATSRVGLQVTYASVLHRPAEEERDHSPAPPAGDGSAPASPISASHAWIVKPLRQRIQASLGPLSCARSAGHCGGSNTDPCFQTRTRASLPPRHRCAANYMASLHPAPLSSSEPARFLWGPLSVHCLQIAGTVYELREIYGIEGSSTAPGGGGSASSASGGSGAVPGGPAGGAAAAAEDVLASGSECVVCLTDKRDTTVLPCRHMCLCYECAQQLRYSTNKCPICRAREWKVLPRLQGPFAEQRQAGRQACSQADSDPASRCSSLPRKTTGNRTSHPLLIAPLPAFPARVCAAPAAVTSLLQIKIGGSAPSSDAGGARAS